MLVNIDTFVDFLIKENCCGCNQCEPRLPSDWSNNVCVEEGRAKWLLEEKKRFIERESEGKQ